jgi:thiol-disulfide isomerase/thioredoxin
LLPFLVATAALTLKMLEGARPISPSPTARPRFTSPAIWATWCPPCVQEMPGLIQLHHDRPDLAILAVSIDEDEDAYTRYIERRHVDLTTVRDPDQSAAKLYHTEGWPETYIIDRQGIIRRKIVGDPDWSNPEIREYLKTL